MHYTYRLLTELRLVIEQIEGEFTVEALALETTRMFADPSYDASYTTIVDFRKAEANMSKVELLGFADLMEQTGMFGRKARWIIIAVDPLIFNLSEIFKNRLNAGDNMRIFSTVQEAADFLENPEILPHMA